MIVAFAYRLLLAGLITAASLSVSQAQPSPKQIKVTIPVPAFVFFPLFYAKSNGSFANAGLDVEIVVTNGDGPDVDALIAGSAQFTVSTPNRLFMAAEQGKKLLAIANLAQRMDLDCIINKGVAGRLGITEQTPLDERLKLMKGLTLAGTRPGAFTYLMGLEYAKRVGLVPQKDMQIVGIGGPSAMLPAVENGQIDIACSAMPMPALALARGKSVMFTNNAAGKDPRFEDFLFEMVYALPDYVSANPDVARTFLKTLFQSVDTIIATPNSALMPALRTQYTGLSDEMLSAIMDETKGIFDPSGIITRTAVEKAGRFLLDTGAIQKAATFDEVADNQYLPAH